MEHVKGGTLDELIGRRGPMPAAVFAPLFGRLCEVVHTAHELGIVHRDIKGSNVMVIERAGQLLPKLLDFGIAKLGAADLDGDTRDGDRRGLDEQTLSSKPRAAARPATAAAADTPDDRRNRDPLAAHLAAGSDGELTAVGATLGVAASLRPAAPEQWTNAADVDARADIYALGALAYRCVSGELPFRGTDRRALAQAHTTRPPPRYRRRPGRAVRRDPARAREAARRAVDDRARVRRGGAVRRRRRRSRGGAAVRSVHARPVAARRPAADRRRDRAARVAAAATTGRVRRRAAADRGRDRVPLARRKLALSTAKTRSEARPLPRRDQPGASRRRTSKPAASTCARAPAGSSATTTPAAVARARPRAAASRPRTDEHAPGSTAALAGSAMPRPPLAARLDSRDRTRTAQTLAADIADATDALRPIEPLLAYQLVVGRGAAAAMRRWQGPRRCRDRQITIDGVGQTDALRDGEVALLDATNHLVTRLSPLAQVIAPLPSAEPEMFLLWRGGRGTARMVAAPWGFERDDDRAGELIAMLSTEDGDTAHDAAGDAPYPGLSPYGVDDADRFVGREREIEALANRLIRAPLLAVLGPSGAGKSSFVHAGVVPRLVASPATAR